MNGDKYYIYYVDTENDKLKKVALELQKTSEGYIEFYINHNSKYLISSKEITKQTILGEDDSLLAKNTALKEKSSIKKSNPIILYSVIAVICIAVIAIVVARKTKKHNKTENNEVTD